VICNRWGKKQVTNGVFIMADFYLYKSSVINSQKEKKKKKNKEKKNFQKVHYKKNKKKNQKKDVI